jgi:hypothetical protein
VLKLGNPAVIVWEEGLLPVENLGIRTFPVIGPDNSSRVQIDLRCFSQRRLGIRIKIRVAQERDCDLIGMEFEEVPISIRAGGLHGPLNRDCQFSGNYRPIFEPT